MRILTTLAALLLAPCAALGAPTIRNGVSSPSQWDSTSSAAVGWIQEGFAGAGSLAAVVEVNTADDGSADGAWDARATVPGPLSDGSNGVLQLPVGDLEGHHRVRVRVDGAVNSPLVAGVIHLDRTPPDVPALEVTAGAGTTSLRFTVSDRWSGIAPTATASVAVQVGETWRSPTTAPAPGAGGRFAVFATGDLADGAYPVRIRVEDAAGNMLDRTWPDGLLVDTTVPQVAPPQLTRSPTPQDPRVEIAYTAADAGSGLDPSVPAQVVDLDTGTVLGQASNEPVQRITAALPGPGAHRIAVRVADRAGLVGTSVPMVVNDPRTVEPPLPSSTPTAGARVRVPVQVGPVAPGARWGYGQVRRYHLRRGMPLTARLVTATTADAWRAALGRADASELAGYSSFDEDVVALGPRTVRGLAMLDARRRCRPCRLTRQQADRIVDALAVTLHETLHATGPEATADYLQTESGAAFEEGFTEAATIDHLAPAIRSLDAPPAVRRALLAAAARHRPRYPHQVAWARRLSATATGTAANSARARRWRITVADTWGVDRWSRLAAATHTPEATLRLDVPITGDLHSPTGP